MSGVKVIEPTMFQQGPVAGMRLGDLGAEVIKVEAPTGPRPGVHAHHWGHGGPEGAQLLL